MTISREELQKLLAEIERLKKENAFLRKAAGITIDPEAEQETTEAEVTVSAEEKLALLRGII